MGCNVVKKSASGVRIEREEVALRHGGDVRHDPRQAVALTRLQDRDRCGDGGRRHAASFPSATSLLRARPKPRFGFAADVLCRLVDRGLVAGQAEEDVVEAGLAQGQAGDGDLRRVEGAEHVGPRLGPVRDRQLDHEVLDDRRLLRERREQLDRSIHGSAVAQGHRDDRGPEVGLELGRRPLGDDAPVVDHHDVAGQAVGFLEVLSRQQDRGAVADQLLDGDPQALAALGVQPRGGLVEEEHRRVRHQCGGQVQPPAHAARVGLQHTITGTGQSEFLEQLVGPARGHLAAQVGEPRHHVDVLPAREVLVHRGVLAGQPDDATHRVGLGDHVVAEDRGASRVGAEDGGEDAHDGGLARPVRAEQPQHGAGLHLEGDPVERADVAAGEDLHELVGLDRQPGM